MRGGCIAVLISLFWAGHPAHSEQPEHWFRIWDDDSFSMANEPSPKMIARCVGMTDAFREYDAGGLSILDQDEVGPRDQVLGMATSFQPALTPDELEAQRQVGYQRFVDSDKFLELDPFGTDSYSFVKSTNICSTINLILKASAQ